MPAKELTRREPMAGRRFDVADVVEVLQHWHAGKSERQQRNQTLPAGEHLGVLAVLGESCDGFIERCWGDVLEGGWLHRRGT